MNPAPSKHSVFNVLPSKGWNDNKIIKGLKKTKDREGAG